MFMCQKHSVLRQEWQSCCLLSIRYVFVVFFFSSLSPSIKNKCIEQIELIRMTVFSLQSSIYGNECIWFVVLLLLLLFLSVLLGASARECVQQNRFNTFVLCVCVRGYGSDTHNLCFIGLFYREIKVHVHKSRAIDLLHVVTHINILLHSAIQCGGFVSGSNWNNERIIQFINQLISSRHDISNS